MLLAFASSFGQTWFISLFAGHIKADFGLTDGAWGSLYTIATLASATLLLMRGSLADTVPLSRLGPLNAVLLACAALALCFGSGIALLGFAVFLLRFCGQGMFSHISVTAMGRWFVATRGRAVSIAGLGYSMGEVLLPVPVVLLIGWIGWQASWGVVAALMALVIAPMLFLLLAENRAPGGYSTASGSPGLINRHWNRAEVLRHWLFAALTPILLTHGFIGTVVFFHQAHVAAVKGWSLTAMAPGLIAYSTVSVVAALAAGWACDRYGAHRLLPIMTLPMGIGMLMIGPADTVGIWITALGFLGVTSGIANALWGALLPAVYGTNHLGAIRALATSVMVVSTAIGPGLTGILIDQGITFPEQGAAMGFWCLGLAVYALFLSRRLTTEMAISGD